MPYDKKGSKRDIDARKVLIAVAIIGIIGLAGWAIWAFLPFAPFGDDDETTTVLTASTFTLYSNVDGEDVSSFTEMDIWVPKAAATFEDGYEDITDLVTNFEREVSGKDADDISEDLRSYPYVWAEVTGNGPAAGFWNNTFYLLTGGANYNYIFYVHDSSSDVNFAIQCSTSMTPLNYTNDPYKSFGAIGWQGGVSTNYTAVLKQPILTKANNHYGAAGWEIDTADFADYTQRNKEDMFNEMNWCDQYPTYDPTIDTSNDFVRDFEIITGAFVLKWTMNGTMSATALANTQVNVTFARGLPIDYLISGVNLYMIWYEGFDFSDGEYVFDFEMNMGTHINVTTVQSGTVQVPGTISSITEFSAYSVIGL